MKENLKRAWREFREGRPGHRFQDRNRRNRQERQAKPSPVRFVKPILAVLLIALGVVFCVIPGPGLPFVIVGLGVLAEYSLRLAQALDWIEIRLRRWLKSAAKWWGHAPILARTAVVIIGVCLALTGTYGAYQLVFNR